MIGWVPLRLRSFVRRYFRVLLRWNGLLSLVAGAGALLSLLIGSPLGLFFGLAVVLVLQVHQFAMLETLFGKVEQLERAAKAQPTAAPSAASQANLPPTQPPVVKAETLQLDRKLKETRGVLASAHGDLIPKVTVVVPVFNEERFLDACLESVSRQTWGNWACIVVDDCSTDRSLAIAKRVASSDKRFTVVQHNINSGLSSARNTGLRLADSDYVTFLDSDDMLMKYGLQMRMSLFPAFRDDSSLLGVYCGIVQVPEDTPVDFVPEKKTFPRTFQDSANTQAECPFNAHAPILRTGILRSLGGFREDMLHGAEDWDLWQRAMRAGFYFRSVPRVGGLYRRKRQSMVRALSLQHVNEAQRLYADAAQEFLPTLGQGVARPFSRPVAEYMEVVSFTKRLVQFAAMGYVQNGETGLNQVVDRVPLSAGAYLSRHLNIRDLAGAGIDRALAVTPPEKEALSIEIGVMLDRIEQAFVERFEQLDGQSEPTFKEPERFDRMFFVADAYEASMALRMAQSAPEARVVFLVPDAVNGDQGARKLIRQSGGLIWSANQFVLFNGCVDAVIFFRRVGFGVADLVSWAEEFSAQTVFVEPQISIEPIAGTLDVDVVFQIETTFEEAMALQLTKQASRVDSAGARQNTFKYSPATLNLEENQIGQPDINPLESLRDKHRGERCVIVGNGPSLNSMDLSLLNDEVSFAVNGIFYKTEETGYRPTYYVVEDSSVMRENQQAIREYDVPFKFFPTIYRNMHPEGENVFFYAMNRGFYEKTGPNYCVPRFSNNFPQRVFVGQSVTYVNLQLAYHMGFSEVYLIGMDFSYVIPDSAIREGDIITSTEDDPNHFNSAYFGKGKTWKDPKLDRVLQNYMMAKRMFEADGRVIYNATDGGALEAFERVDFNSVFGRDS